MFLVYAGKLRAKVEGGVGRLRAERESLSAVAVKDALVEIPLEFEGRNGWARPATRLRRTRESMLADQVGGKCKGGEDFCRLFHPLAALSDDRGTELEFSATSEQRPAADGQSQQHPRF